MKLYKRGGLAVIALTGAALVAAGCGGSGSGSSKAATSSKALDFVPKDAVGYVTFDTDFDDDAWKNLDRAATAFDADYKGTEKQIVDEIEKDDENLRLLRQEISHQKGSTYFARMQYGRLVDSLLQERSEKLISEIVDTLSSVCVASRTNKPIGDKMILNGAFLVARDREPDFDAKVKEIVARYESLIFKYTGPWPPYNFVNIKLKLEKATG